MKARTSATPISMALLAAVLLAAGPVPIHAQTAASLLDRLEKKYDSIDALRAGFSQTLASAFSSETATLAGTVVLAGDRYRLETETQIMVTDGTTSWIYLPDENQVLINAAESDETAFSPSEFFSDFDENYAAELSGRETIGGDRHFVIQLKPKQADSFFISATVYMRDRDDLVTQMEVVDVNETTMLFKMTNIEVNPSIPPGSFTFKPPAGVEVIDLRDQ